MAENNYPWVSSCGKVAEDNLAELILSKTTAREYLYVAFYTDKLGSGIVTKGITKPAICDYKHLLELRIFNEDEEFRAVRTAMKRTFTWRVASEADVDEMLYSSEIQLLDKDEKMLDKDEKLTGSSDGVNTKFRATGGGCYTLPVSREADRIEIVNYICYDEYGNIQFSDYRIKRFFFEQNERSR